MHYNEILKGDLEDEERLETNRIATNRLLKLFLAIKLSQLFKNKNLNFH